MAQARVKEDGVARGQRHQRAVRLIEQAAVHGRRVVDRVEQRPVVRATEDLEAAVFGVGSVERNHYVDSAKLPNAPQCVSEQHALWQALRSSQLGVGFRRQAVVAGCIADFLAPSRRLIVEVDGAYHRSPAQRRSDTPRDRRPPARRLPRRTAPRRARARRPASRHHHHLRRALAPGARRLSSPARQLPQDR
jgi:hypothetical protein